VRVHRTLLVSLTAFLLSSGKAGAIEHEFRFEKSDAQRVELMAEFNQWKALPMTKQNDGTWTVTVSVSPGTYGYKFLVNGTDWLFDPKNPNRRSVNGVENSAIEITETSSSSAVTTAPSIASPVQKSVGEADASPARTFPGKLTASPTATGSLLAPTAGEVLNLEVPLSDKRRAEAVKEGATNVHHAKVAIAVPQGFDPQKSWPVLIINNTEDYPNIDSLNQFKQAALDENWVIMAADPPEAEKDKQDGWRWATIAAAMDYVVATWPAAKDWPIACGGMSGGAKNSTFIAAAFARDHHRLIGMLMMGCNQDMASVAFHQSAPPNFLGVPVFLSSGKSDTIATPAQHEAVKNSLRGTGFQKVRLEHFDGAHDVYQPHIGEALKWFVAESNKNNPTQRASSDFDKFFKKKP
jgi:Glycogen recognition site of AMP-activated protein kinase